MKTIVLLIVLTGLLSCFQPKQVELTDRLTYSKSDSLMVVDKIRSFLKYRSGSTQKAFENIALSFIGTPYVAHTLETDTSESLVINLDAFDCTTFIETCLALTITIQNQNANFNDYSSTLKQIRYRNGNINNYSSRLHYFTEWILNNEQKGFISNITQELGGVVYQKKIDFMSTHSSAYKQLANDTTLIKTIKEIETQLSNCEQYFIPKENIANIESMLESGLIVAFTTSINGLDIIHTGITTRVENEIRLLHASSDLNKITISEKTLNQYIMSNKLQSGIMLIKIK